VTQWSTRRLGRKVAYTGCGRTSLKFICYFLNNRLKLKKRNFTQLLHVYTCTKRPNGIWCFLIIVAKLHNLGETTTWFCTFKNLLL